MSTSNTSRALLSQCFGIMVSTNITSNITVARLCNEAWSWKDIWRCAHCQFAWEKSLKYWYWVQNIRMALLAKFCFYGSSNIIQQCKSPRDIAIYTQSSWGIWSQVRVEQPSEWDLEAFTFHWSKAPGSSVHYWAGLSIGDCNEDQESWLPRKNVSGRTICLVIRLNAM